MVKGNFGALLELAAALSLFFSAAAAWLSKRNATELKVQTPRRKRRARAEAVASGADASANGITVKDALVNVLDEVNRIHRRLDKAKIPSLEREDDAA